MVPRHPIVDLHQDLVVRLGRVPFLELRTGSVAKALSQVVVAQDPSQRGGEVRRVASIEEQTGAIMLDQLLNPAETRSHNGDTTRERLGDGQREVLVAQRWYDDCTRPHDQLDDLVPWLPSDE
jgi:hypothetical protein